MLRNSLRKTTDFFKSSVISHRAKPKLEFDQIKNLNSLNKYFKKHKEVYKNKARLIENAKDLEACKSLLFNKLSTSGIIEDSQVIKPNSSDLYFPNLRVIALKNKKEYITAVKVFFDEEMEIPAQKLIPKELNIIRNGGYKLIEISPIAVKEKNAKDKFFQNDTNNLYAASIMKTFCGVINHVYQFSNASHIVILTTKSDKEIYEYIGFHEIADNIRASHFPHANLHALTLDVDKFLNLADKHIPAYLSLINLEILKKNDPIKFKEEEIFKFFSDNPFIAESLSNNEKDSLINCYPTLKSIFYMKTIGVRSTSSYRKETIQFLVNSNELSCLKE